MPRFTSLENADYVTEKGLYYVFGLKDNQPRLLNYAQLLMECLQRLEPPDAETDWECRNGKKIRRLLWRTDLVNEFKTSAGEWKHLQQVWLVRQETMDKDGCVEIENRYFVSSIPWYFLTAQQILLLVRNHWGIENDVFNSLDLQWREDQAPWCTKGFAIWALAVLRLMAYNLTQFCRKRHLRRKNEEGELEEPLPWRRLFDLFRDVIRANFAVPEIELTTI